MIAIAFGGAFFLYAVVGVAGCAYARCVGSEVPSNVLLMFDEHDPTASAMRLALSLVLLIQLPLVCLPCRLMLTSLIAFCADCTAPALDGRGKATTFPLFAREPLLLPQARCAPAITHDRYTYRFTGRAATARLLAVGATIVATVTQPLLVPRSPHSRCIAVT